MDRVPMQIINLDTDDEEDIPTSYHNARNTSSSHLCEVRPSSSVTASSIDKSQKGKGSSGFVSSQTHTGLVKTPRKKIVDTTNTVEVSSKKIITRTVPSNILPKSKQFEFISNLNLVASGTSSSKKDITRIQRIEGKPDLSKSKKNLYIISPIPNDPKNPITKIMLLKQNSAGDNSTTLKLKERDVLKKSVIGQQSNQQQVQLPHNISNVNNQAVKARRGSVKKNIIREQRVYVKELIDSMYEEEAINSNSENRTMSTTGHVTDEQDPLYIPGMQLRERMTPSASVAPQNLYRRAITPNPTRKRRQRRISHSPTPQQDPLFIPAPELQKRMSLSFSNKINTTVSQPPRRSTRSTTPKPTKISERSLSQSAASQKDPPYIPGRNVQEKVTFQSKFRDAIVSLPSNSRPRRSASLLRKTPEPRISANQENEIEDQSDLDIFTPIVTLTELTNSEHSVVRNYSLLNKVAATKEHRPVRCKSVPPKLTKKDKIVDLHPGYQKIHLKDVPAKTPKKDKLINSDLVYRKIVIADVMKSDNCRNFFIKNSAWDYLEPVFKGFNEREQNISESCSRFFSRLLKSPEKKKKETIIRYLTNEELFYTRKIEVLDKEGKLDKVYYVPPENQVTRKRRASSPYKLPETKKCKVVLQREENVENLLKKYLMRERLNSLLSEELVIPKVDANKPLIILNRVNLNVLKVNDILCQHSNIIYVKHADEGFPEKLFKNDFFVSQLEKKVIRMVTPNALKIYFQ